AVGGATIRGDATLTHGPDRPLDVELREERSLGRIRVLATAEPILVLVDEVVTDLRDGRIENVEVRLPLDADGVPALVEALEKQGFFVAGVDPEVEGARDEL